MSQIPDKSEGSLLLPLQIRKSSNNKGTMSGAITSPNLNSQILDSPQYITISDTGQHSTRMRCYFHSQHNHFIHFFNDPVPDGAVNYAGNIPFQYNEQDGTFMKFSDNPTGNVFLAASRDHKFLSSHKGTTSHISHTPMESRKSNHDYINNFPSSQTTHKEKRYLSKISNPT